MSGCFWPTGFPERRYGLPWPTSNRISHRQNSSSGWEKTVDVSPETVSGLLAMLEENRGHFLVADAGF